MFIPAFSSLLPSYDWHMFLHYVPLSQRLQVLRARWFPIKMSDRVKNTDKEEADHVSGALFLCPRSRKVPWLLCQQRALRIPYSA